MNEDYITKLVIARLQAMPPNVSFSIGEYGDFTKDQLITQVAKGTAVGKATIELELNFLRELPKLSEKLASNE